MIQFNRMILYQYLMIVYTL